MNMSEVCNRKKGNVDNVNFLTKQEDNAQFMGRS